MKILYFLDRYKSFGGAANNMLHQAAAMQQLDNKVLVILPVDKNGMCQPEMKRRCKQLKLNSLFAVFEVATSLRTINIIKAWEDILEIEELIQQENPDIIHSLQINVTVAIVCKKLKIPHVMSIYSIMESEFLIHYTDICAQYLVTDSEYYKNIWENGLGVEGICIRNSLKEKKYKKKSKNKDKVQILILGHICRIKNQLEAIKMLQLCEQTNISVHLTICGYQEGEYANQCKEYVESHNLQDRVTFTGFVSDVFEYLYHSDLLLCASIRESFPFSITESMMMRIPVLATNIAGIPEIIENGVSGYLSNGVDSKALFRAFLNFYIDWKNDRISIITENAFQIYLKENTPEITEKRLKEFYRYVIENTKYIVDSDTLNNVNNEVKQIYQKAEDYKDIFCDCTFVKAHIWNIYHLLNSKWGDSIQNIYIWGAGKIGKEVLHIIKYFFPKWKVIGFIDSTKREQSYEGYQVFPPEEARREQAIIVLAFERNNEDVVFYLENVYQEKGTPYLSFV